MSEHLLHTISRPALPLANQRERLAQARYQRDWSQQELADLLGTTPLNISRWERGLTSPRLTRISATSCAPSSTSARLSWGCAPIPPSSLLPPSRSLPARRVRPLFPAFHSPTPSCRCRRRCRWWGEPPCSPGSRASWPPRGPSPSRPCMGCREWVRPRWRWSWPTTLSCARATPMGCCGRRWVPSPTCWPC